MSYCVNCGVELEPSEKQCPLCQVVVQNPARPFDERAVRPYPRRLDPINERLNRQFIGAILSIILAFPAVLCLAINYSIDGQLTWSLYVIGALALAWTVVCPYYFWRRRTVNKIYLPIVAVLLGYLLLIAALQDSLGLFVPLTLPLVLIPAFLVYVNLQLALLRLIRGFVIPAAAVISAGLLVTGIELVLKGYREIPFLPAWSLYVLIPCLALAMVFLALARRQSILDEIKRRLHL